MSGPAKIRMMLRALATSRRPLRAVRWRVEDSLGVQEAADLLVRPGLPDSPASPEAEAAQAQAFPE